MLMTLLTVAVVANMVATGYLYIENTMFRTLRNRVNVLSNQVYDLKFPPQSDEAPPETIPVEETAKADPGA